MTQVKSILISFNALAQYRLALDYVTEAFMITHFMVATRSGTSAAGISLPPVHGAQKGVDPTLKPESQSKSQQTLVKPTPITPGRKVLNPVVRWTPSQTPAKSRLKSHTLFSKSNSQKFAKYSSTTSNSYTD